MRQLRKNYSPPVKKIPKDKRTVTPLIWYGGKSTMVYDILKQVPPHDGPFVDVFGGGAAITFAKNPSKLDVYNDIGNVSNFFKVMRERGDELYELLYLTPWSREEFLSCRDFIDGMIPMYYDDKTKKFKFDDVDWDTRIEWARCWYVRIMQSFSHEEMATSWKMTYTSDLAFTWNNKVEELPRFIDILRSKIIENLDYMDLIKKYDSPETFFYLDPPYVKGTRAEGSRGAYMNEMDISRHVEMLYYLVHYLKGQAIVSMYDYPKYNEMLKDWRRVEITRNAMIKNSSVTKNRLETEVLWIKEHIHGLWSLPELTSADVAGVEG